MATIETTAAAPKDYRWLLIVGLYVAAATEGFTRALGPGSVEVCLGTLLMASTAAGWCMLDARRRGKPLSDATQLLAFLFWFLAAPLYLVVSRGWRWVGWAFFNAVGLYVVLVGSSIATYYLAWGVMTKIR